MKSLLGFLGIYSESRVQPLKRQRAAVYPWTGCVYDDLGVGIYGTFQCIERGIHFTGDRPWSFLQARLTSPFIRERSIYR